MCVFVHGFHKHFVAKTQSNFFPEEKRPDLFRKLQKYNHKFKVYFYSLSGKIVGLVPNFKHGLEIPSLR